MVESILEKFSALEIITNSEHFFLKNADKSTSNLTKGVLGSSAYQLNELYNETKSDISKAITCFGKQDFTQYISKIDYNKILNPLIKGEIADTCLKEI